MKPVAPTLLEDCLFLYPPERRHLTDWRYGGRILMATLLPHDADYGTITVDYYTASQFVLTASQMSYVLSGCLFFDPDVPELTENLYPKFMDRMRVSDLYYTKINMRFRRKTYNKTPHTLSFALGNITRKGDLYFLVSKLTLPDRHGMIEISTAMNLGT